MIYHAIENGIWNFQHSKYRQRPIQVHQAGGVDTDRFVPMARKLVILGGVDHPPDDPGPAENRS